MKVHPTADGWSAWDSYYAALLTGLAAHGDIPLANVPARAASLADEAMKERQARVKANDPDNTGAEVKP